MLPAWKRAREYVTYEAKSVPRYHPCSTQRPSTHGRLITGRANLADQPSRGEMEILDEYGSAPFTVRWPDLESAWGDACGPACGARTSSQLRERVVTGAAVTTCAKVDPFPG